MKGNLFTIFGLAVMLAGCSAQSQAVVPPHVTAWKPLSLVAPESTDSHGCSQRDWYFANEYRVDKAANVELNQAFAADRRQDERRLAALRYDTSLDAKIERHELQTDLADNFGNNENQVVKDDWHAISKPCQHWLAP